MTTTSQSVITIQCVHGGFILSTPTKTEVLTSTAKLNKAVRAAIEEYSLVAKTKGEVEE